MGSSRGRPSDKVRLGRTVNGLPGPHRDFLAAGGARAPHRGTVPSIVDRCRSSLRASMPNFDFGTTTIAFAPPRHILHALIL
jgi:hypothetical protein